MVGWFCACFVVAAAMANLSLTETGLSSMGAILRYLEKRPGRGEQGGNQKRDGGK